MAERTVSASRTIDAAPEKIFDILADPAKHPLIDGSGSVRAVRDGSTQRLAKGSTFGMDMKIGVGYRITNTVVEFEENRLIAWRHFAGHRWRWQLAPNGDGGTEVTETFDWSRAPGGFVYPLLGFPRSNLAAIKATLQRLAEVFDEKS